MNKYSKGLRLQFQTEVADQKKVILEKLKMELVHATPVDTGEARSGWQVIGDALVNNVKHISLLNAGTSAQAPSFFIERTVLQNPNVKPAGIIVTHLTSPEE